MDQCWAYIGFAYRRHDERRNRTDVYNVIRHPTRDEYFVRYVGAYFGDPAYRQRFKRTREPQQLIPVEVAGRSIQGFEVVRWLKNPSPIYD